MTSFILKIGPKIGSLFFLVSLASGLCLAEPPPMAVIQQNALRQAFDEMGLGSNERKFFEAEALADATLFVTNFKSTADGTDVQIDREKLKNFLKFSANLFGVAVPDGATSQVSLPVPVCVTVRPSSGCTACEDLARKTEDGFTQRLKRRGFFVKTGPRPSEESQLEGDRAFDDYVSRAAESQCSGALYAEIQPDNAADEDDEGDEIKLRSVSYLLIREISGKKMKARASAVILAKKDVTNLKSNLELAGILVSRQSAELFANTAAQFKETSTKLAASERYLRLQGVKDFSTYVAFKRFIGDSLPDARLEERFISPGVFEFALGSETKLGDLSAQLKGLASSKGSRLKIISASEDDLTVEF